MSNAANKFEDKELEALLDEDCCQMREKFAKSLVVTQASILKRLKLYGRNRVTYELKSSVENAALTLRKKLVFLSDCNR